MAIFHCNIQIGSRGAGRSAVAASAYRAGDKVKDHETGLEHDFSRKSGVLHQEILLPKNAPEAFRDRETLWNSAQSAERQADGQVFREAEFALPKEWPLERQIQVAREYAQENFVNRGMCVDMGIHYKNGNPHVHYELTMRGIDANGNWQAKRRDVYANDRDENGRAIFNPDKPSGKEYRIPRLDKETGVQKRDKKGALVWERVKVETNDWNNPSNAEMWRKNWATKCNQYLLPSQQIDHRSYVRQGIDKIPQIHEGHGARAMERRGKVSDRCQLNREIRRLNEARQALENERNGIIVDLEKARIERVLRRRNEELKRSVYNDSTREQNPLDRSGDATRKNRGGAENPVRRADQSDARSARRNPRHSFADIGRARDLSKMSFFDMDKEAPRVSVLLPDTERDRLEIERSTGMRDHGVQRSTGAGGRAVDGKRIKDIITRRKAAEKSAIKEQRERIGATADKIAAIKTQRETDASKQALETSVKALKTGAKLAVDEVTKLLPGDAKKLADAAIQTITAAANPANLLPHKAFMNAAKIIMACAAQGEKQAAAFLHNPGAAQEKIKSRWDLMTQSEKDQALADAERAFFLDEMGETGLSSFMKNYKPKAMPMPEHDRAKVRTL